MLRGSAERIAVTANNNLKLDGTIEAANRYYKFVHLDNNGDDVHDCTDQVCSLAFNPDVTRREPKRLHTQCMFPSVPARREKGQWTLLGACLDWHVVAKAGN